MAVLQAYGWPGNVRELQHVVERAVILSPDPVLGLSALDPARFGLTAGGIGVRGPAAAAARAAHDASANGAPGDHDAGGSAHPMRVVLHSLDVNEAERVLIERALVVAENNRTRAAELLGISVRTLRNKLNGPGREG
jgi:DNA-binding NtrC family response regulator